MCGQDPKDFFENTLYQLYPLEGLRKIRYLPSSSSTNLSLRYIFPDIFILDLSEIFNTCVGSSKKQHQIGWEYTVQTQKGWENNIEFNRWGIHSRVGYVGKTVKNSIGWEYTLQSKISWEYTVQSKISWEYTVQS